MVVILLVLFDVRWRLLPLVVILIGVVGRSASPATSASR